MKLTIIKSWVLLFIIGIILFTIYHYKTKQTDLGSYENPEIALQETQKVLTTVSIQLNLGMKSVLYVKEYELAKNKIFTE